MNADFFVCAKNNNVTDVHIIPDEVMRLRLNGKLQKTEKHIPFKVWNSWWQNFADERVFESLKRTGAAELSVFYGCNLRLSLYMVSGRVEGSIRILPELYELPQDPELSLLGKIAFCDSGLVLIGGATGSGKTSTLMRILDIINKERSLHIIMLEDPPEFNLSSQQSCIRRRVVGSDTPDFATGLRSALREDPDVIVLGELRDKETLATALLAAETGHLVMATVHGGNITEIIGRVIHAFPAEKQQETRFQLASVLRWVMAQKLIPLTERRILLREYVQWNTAMATLVHEGTERQLESYLQTMGNNAQTWADAVRKITTVANLSSAEKEILNGLLHG